MSVDVAPAHWCWIKPGSMTHRVLAELAERGPLTNRDLVPIIDDISCFVARTMARLIGRGLVKNERAGEARASYAITDDGRHALRLYVNPRHLSARHKASDAGSQNVLVRDRRPCLGAKAVAK